MNFKLMNLKKWKTPKKIIRKIKSKLKKFKIQKKKNKLIKVVIMI